MRAPSRIGVGIEAAVALYLVAAAFALVAEGLAHAPAIKVLGALMVPAMAVSVLLLLTLLFPGLLAPGRLSSPLPISLSFLFFALIRFLMALGPDSEPPILRHDGLGAGVGLWRSLPLDLVVVVTQSAVLASLAVLGRDRPVQGQTVD
ncbi:MAG: hypothetical protein HYR64_01425 [Fimbriimonas ginsengisoli]|uniref:Uncharacterized protein n=1 Tax=Fimbriimonas ginsengisoli TaxID=1005039 RepID=A0A931LTX3_FIMGI|nr:hypothetical protein [Fimbriimonas ginsengisoli]